MLPLPSFEYLHPTHIDEAVAMLAESPDETRVIAGGTDLLPNMKHGLVTPRRLVSLSRIAALKQIDEREDRRLWIGAGVSLRELASSSIVCARFPALAEASNLVAGPQLRSMATIGGNLCLDTRCIYYNQSAFWRAALGYCLKKDGTECHVIRGGSRCVAAFSADTPGPLIVYNAKVHLVSMEGERVVPVADFFVADGIHNTVRRSHELVSGISISFPEDRLQSSYTKLRLRQAIDFPLLSLALSCVFDENDVQKVKRVRIVVGALQAIPRQITRLDELVSGQTIDDTLLDAIGTHVTKQCHPVANQNVDAIWRRDVIRTHLKRAFATLQPSLG